MIRAACSSLLLLIALVSCREPDAYSYESNTSGEQQETQQGTEGTGPPLEPGESYVEEFPTVWAPFEAELDMTYEFSVFDGGVKVQSLRERLFADGEGRTSLSLLSVSGSDGVWKTPTPWKIQQHAGRQLFLTRYRGVRIFNPETAARNYEWRKLDGNFTVAGVAVDRYRLRSKFEIGDVVFDLDRSTGVILRWTVFTPEGEPLLRQVATAVDYQPDFQGVQWATLGVDTYDYDGQGELGHLGFEPLTLKTSGPGFEGTEEKALMTQNLFTDHGNMHLYLLDDGVRSVAIAQEETGVSQVVVGHEVKATTLNRADAGGVTILEGRLFTKHVYAVGSIPFDDLRVLLAGLEQS